MHLTTSPPSNLPAGRLLSPQDAAFQLLEAAALAGYGSGGRTGLLPVLAAGQPAYCEAEVRFIAGAIRDIANLNRPQMPMPLQAAGAGAKHTAIHAASQCVQAKEEV